MLATVKKQNLVYSQQNLQEIIYYSKLKHFNKGELLPLTINSVWLLKSGVVKTLTWNEAGKTTILGYWGEGDVIGFPLSKVNPYEAKCLSKVEGVYLPWEQCNYLFKEISHCLQQTDELLRIVRIEKMYQRLGQLLILLANKFGYQILQGVLIDVRLTHQELADIIGSTRVTVTRLLNRLEQEKMIIRSRRFSIIIRDINLLEKKLKFD